MQRLTDILKQLDAAAVGLHLASREEKNHYYGLKRVLFRALHGLSLDKNGNIVTVKNKVVYKR